MLVLLQLLHLEFPLEVVESESPSGVTLLSGCTIRLCSKAGDGEGLNL